MDSELAELHRGAREERRRMVTFDAPGPEPPSPRMPDLVTYLTTLECENGHRVVIAHTGPWVPADVEAPWPDDVALCSTCGDEYPEDLAEAIVEVREATIVEHPEVPPEERADD